jgi:hypothetical protein
MRDVNWGWLIRYLHSTGASAFFIVIYLHMYRGLMTKTNMANEPKKYQKLKFLGV